MTSNQPYEVQAVAANFRNFFDWNQVDSVVMLEDVSLVNNNTIWRAMVELTYPVGDMDSTGLAQNEPPTGNGWKNDIWLMAWDDACNPETTHVEVLQQIDLDAPTWVSDGEYKITVDNDTNYCANFGDTIRIKVDLLEVLDDDIASVTADLIGGGLNRDGTAALNDAGTDGDQVAGDWTYTLVYGISLKTEITATEPLPQDAKDANGWYVPDAPLGSGDFTIVITAKDIHGNTIVDTLSLVDVDDDPAMLDTKRPEMILPGTVNAYPIGQENNGQGKIAITFPKDYVLRTIDTDAVKFHIYEVTGGSWGAEVGITTIAELDGSGDSIRWESEYIDDGQSVTYGLRSEDDCGNFEFNNQVVVSTIADGLPATACFIYPVPPYNGSHGPNNPISVTALINPDVSGLAGATLAYRIIDAGGGTPGPWLFAATGMSRPFGGTILYDTLNIGNDIWDAGEYEMVITTVDSAGNELTAQEAYDDDTCDPIEFTWHLDDNWAYIVDINGEISPGIGGCWDVTRDTLNKVTVSLAEVDEDTLYGIDAWVIINFAGDARDSIRIHYEDGVTLPFTFDFSVFDWPKTNDIWSTTLFVEITDLRSLGVYATSADLCVPDEMAPDVWMAAPYNCSRVPIAKSDLNAVELKVKKSPLSYDGQNAIRAEFFYMPYNNIASITVDSTFVVEEEDTIWTVTADTVFAAETKIGESGWDQINGWATFAWNNKGMEEGWLWLYAKVYDEFGNFNFTPWIKVYLDGTAPFMTLSGMQFTLYDGGWHLAQNTNGGIVDLVAEITDYEVDIAKVDFYLGMRDSVDVFRWYQYLGTGAPANNNSIWTYAWDHTTTVWAIDTIWVGDEGEEIDHIDTTFGIPCGYNYKLRIMITDIAGNVYDDMDGSGFFDDYTFWDYPWNPIGQREPADGSKLLFYYDCGAPDVAFCDVWTMGEDTLWFPTPSAKLGGPDVVYSFMGHDIKMDICLTDTLEQGDLVGMKADYYFWSPVVNGYKLVCTSYDVENTGKWECTFNPWDLGLIRQEHIQGNEYHSYLKVIFTDSLYQTSEDVISLYLLDNIPGFAWWQSPTHDDCLWDTPTLSLRTINADSLKKVTYYYSTDTTGSWTEIGTVWNSGNGFGYNFPISWATLPLPDGAYYLGFEIVDRNDNVTPIDSNQIIMVTVNNVLPTVEITSPGLPLADDFDFETAPYFLSPGKTFVADADGAGNGVSWVQFEYKWYNDGPTSWTPFDEPADEFPPYQSNWECQDDSPKAGNPGSALDDAYCSEGFYHFRAKVRNNCGRIGYSEWYIGFNDETCPDGTIITVNGYDTENSNDPMPCFAVGSNISFDLAVYDTASSFGSSELVNSGVAGVEVFVSTGSGGPGDQQLVFDASVSDGIHTFEWITSGLYEGDYYLTVWAYDNAGNYCQVDQVEFCLYDDCPPPALIAGYEQCRLIGVSEYGADVQFQAYPTDAEFTLPASDGDWISVGIAEPVSDAYRTDYSPCADCCEGWVDYQVFATYWNQVDEGNFLVRLIATGSGGTTYGTPLPLVVNNCEGVAARNPDDFGPATIEKAWETGECDLDGLATIQTAYDYPFAVSFAYNAYEDDFGVDDGNVYSYEFVSLRAIPQQGPRTEFAGDFDLDAIEPGGYGFGHVFFFDDDADLDYAFSLGAHVDAYWIIEDLGTGGPVTFDDDKVTVEVPPEFTNDDDGDDQLLVIWQSKLAPTSVIDDVTIKPLGNANGDYMYFIGQPDCEDTDICGDDHQYATIKMYYDPEVDLSAGQLQVMWYDGGHWYSSDIYFPSAVEGFNTDENYVEFATECLHGFFAVVTVQDAPCDFAITREYITPWCDGYTYGRPDFQYRIPEIFDNTIDWGWLEIQVDGVRIYTGSDLESGGDGSKGGADATALGIADGWDVDIDPESGRIFFHMDPEWLISDDGDYPSDYDDEWDHYYMPPLACGDHVVTISAKSDQLRDYCITDEFMVDCEEPDVDFANGYVSKNPEFTFSITDDGSGVDWDEVYVDIFFITKYDTTAGGNDNTSHKERVMFMQTFYPDQVKAYMISANTATITTTYELDDERAILVAIYNGERHCNCIEGQGVDPSSYDNYDEFYYNHGGVYDCVGNYTSPHLQILAVDYDAPSIVKTTPDGSCPEIFTVAEDGSGMTSLVIYENGQLLSTEASSVSDVDESGEYYLHRSSGEAATLYYCPSDDTDYEVHLTDNVGNVRVYNYSTQVRDHGTLADDGIDAYSMPNPYERGNHTGGIKIMFDLVEDAWVKVKVYDLAGDLVATLYDGNKAPGEQYVTWNGLTENGIEVATGVYLVHVEAAAGNSAASDVVKVAIIQD